MNIETFLKGLNKKSKDYNDSNELFRVPKGDKLDDIPHIKNNISDPNMPPMYMVNKLNHEDKIDNTVAYTINQLLKVKS